jgi:hypothetical protein
MTEIPFELYTGAEKAAPELIVPNGHIHEAHIRVLVQPRQRMSIKFATAIIFIWSSLVN